MKSTYMIGDFSEMTGILEHCTLIRVRLSLDLSSTIADKNDEYHLKMFLEE